MAVSDNGDLREILREFPSDAVKDLFSIGDPAYGLMFPLRFWTGIPLSLFLLRIECSVFGDLTDSENPVIQSGIEDNKDSSNPLAFKGPEVKLLLCSLCLGILQFAYRNDNGFVVRKDSATDFSASIVERVKQDGHQIDGFSLEVSIPPVIQENEHSIWFYMKKKYGSEPWFQRKSLSECVSVKDALKTSITKPLETLLVS
ncbi:hypothetical protein TorRG33x02_103830 [Trema orientale]|uniref:Pus10 N-terminal eukaryotes domain-containing protein n=1 Tax=Trema orientale TaxID=63057 RepID=A0A2P5F869_TREOI|nr:hypothetical protein TorRG33x02_103830 [Trema orientale]